jgi:hypothetical protein
MSRLILFALVASACAPTPAAGPAALDRDELAALLRPEPHALASEYRVYATRLRLFGVQPGDGGRAPTATLADTATWATRTLAVGELYARNLALTAVDGTRAILTASDGQTIVLLPGEEAVVREIRHRFDEAAQYQGRHRWIIDSAAMGEVGRRYGAGAQAEPRHLGATATLALTEVSEGGVLARAGFRAGDLILAVDSTPAAQLDVAMLAARLAAPGPALAVAVLRGGSRLNLSFRQL